MERWSDMGWLGRAATVSFCGGMIGAGLAVIAGKIFDSGEVLTGVLVAWFAPALVWLIAVWASSARDNFGATCGVITALCALSVFSVPSDSADLLPLLLVALVMLSAFLAIGGKFARDMLDWGRGS